MKNILVTGDQGFIGKHLVKKLKDQGYNIVGLDLKNGEDISSAVCIIKKLNKNNIDCIVHLAAESNVRDLEGRPTKAVKTNIFGSTMLLDLALQFGVKNFIYAGSGGARYADGEALKERQKPCPKSLYGISKHTVEHFIEYYRRKGLNAVTIALGNVYGYGDESDRIIPNLFKSFEKECEIDIYGDGKQTRDFVHVDDVTFFISYCIENEVKFRKTIYNYSYGMPVQINEVIESFEKVYQNKIKVNYKEPNKQELTSNSLSIEQLMNDFDNLYPIYPIDEGLGNIYDQIRTEGVWW